MPSSFEPPRDRRFLAEAPLHVVVMTLPETLPVFRDHGVELAVDGGAPLADLDGETDDLLEALRSATAWRGAPSGEG